MNVFLFFCWLIPKPKNHTGEKQKSQDVDRKTRIAALLALDWPPQSNDSAPQSVAG